jgi:lysophospholipase L1-like esterase
MQSEFAITPGLQSQPKWVATWGASPVNPTATNPDNVGFTNQTLRIIAHTSMGGNPVRLRLANLFSTNALVIGAAHVAIAGTNATIVPGSDTPLTFQGAGSVTISPGGLVLSDAAAMAVPPLTNLAVSLFISGTNGPATWHPESNQTNYVSTTGDFTGAAALPVDHTNTSSYYLIDVEVGAASNALAIVALGDSITDGHRSTINANRRWPDDLAGRVAGAQPPLAVVNEGIAGNRLLQNDVGPSGLSRFDRDVLMQAGVAYVIVLLGVNDIGKSSTNQPVSAAQIIAGYVQLVARAHTQKLKYLGCTLTPFGRSVYDKPGNESIREVVNAYYSYYQNVFHV